MKNRHQRRASVPASSTWSQSSSAARLSVLRVFPVAGGPARAFASSSRDSISSGHPEPPHHASVLRFALKRAPDRDDTGPGASAGRDTNVFDGRTILVVEDDFIVAFDVQTLLEEHGARVLGPASSVAEARAILARETPNLAVLDVNLNGEFVFPIADELRQRQVPFVFATAYADDDQLFPGDTVRAPRLAKPVLPKVLIGQLRKMLD